MFKTLLELKGKMLESKKKIILLSRSEGMITEKFQKIVEHVFYDEEGCRIDIHRPVMETAKIRKPFRAVVIGASDTCSYADLLRGIRADTEANKGIVITNARKTKEGGAVLLVKGNREKAEELTKLISQKHGTILNTRIETRGKKMLTIHIKHMDALSTEEEVVEAIKTVAPNISSSEIRVTMRNTLGAPRRRS